MTTWKRNLVSVWLSQFLCICGFSLAMPFAPFFIQELGVTDPDQVKLWSALSSSSTAIALAIMGPIWGMLADRYGRRLMMLRASFAAVAVLLGMAFSPNVYVFVLLRFCQGAFTGTIGASTAFIATSTPQERQGVALGSLSAAVFSGFMVGPLVGGMLAESIGYRRTFLVSSILLLGAGVVVLMFVRESFVRPPALENPPTWRERVAALGPGLPILGLLMFMSMARTFDQPVLALYVQQIHGSLQGASFLTGMLHGTAAIGGAAAGITVGRLCDRMAVPLVGKLSAVAAGVFVGMMGIVPIFPVIFPARMLLAFAAGGLDPVFQVWLSRVTPQSKRGTIFWVGGDGQGDRVGRVSCNQRDGCGCAGHKVRLLRGPVALLVPGARDRCGKQAGAEAARFRSNLTTAMTWPIFSRFPRGSVAGNKWPQLHEIR